MKDIICRWDEVTGADGYNVFLKKIAPEDYNTVYNGVDQYINSGVLDYGSVLSDITIEVTFNNTDSSVFQTLLGTTNESFSMICTLGIHQDRFQNHNANYIFFQLRDHNANQVILATDSAYAQISDGNLHTISVTKDSSSNIVMYLDGVSVPIIITTNEILSSFVNFDYPLIIGANNGRGTINKFFKGSINEVRLWTVIRSSTEIANNIDSKLDGNEPELHTYYPMIEGTGNSTEDIAGNSNGTFVGNVNDNMWELVPNTDEFIKQNTQLITGLEYVIEDLEIGVDYEAYSVASLGGIESDPSNIEAFTITLNTGSLFFPEVSSFGVGGNSIIIPKSSQNNITGDATFEFWMNPMVGNRSYYAICMNGPNSSPRQYTVFIANDQNTLKVHLEQEDVGDWDIPGTEGVWTHVAVVSENNVFTLYLNGVSQGSFTASFGITEISGGELYIGKRAPNDFSWEGKIDEVRLWNIARTQTQINNNKNSVLEGNESGLVGYYKFDDNTNLGFDSSQYANHGTAEGLVEYSEDTPY